MGGKWGFGVLVGVVWREERVESGWVWGREKGVFLIVFVGFGDIFVMFGGEMKVERYGRERRDRKKREENNGDWR